MGAAVTVDWTVGGGGGVVPMSGMLYTVVVKVVLLYGPET